MPKCSHCYANLILLVGVHVNDIKEDNLMEFANKIRIMLKQKSLAFELNNRLILVEELHR